MDEVRQSLEPKISHVLADYQMYKETHDALLQIPFVKLLLENQCKCNSAAKTPHDPIQLEIIDAAVDGLSNLDSITEYVNATVVSEAASEAEEAEEAEEEAVSEAEEEAVSEAEEEEEEEE
jgi:ribosomal protein L12E/L44/L45/RPP1/RPP2